MLRSMTRFLWFLLVAALLAGQAIAAEPLQVERRQIDRKLPGCGNAKDGCVHVSFDYVEALSGPPAVRAKIDSAVIGVLLWRPGNDPPRSLPDYAQGFIKDYQESPKLFADQRWFISKTVKVLRATPPVFRPGMLGGILHRRRASVLRNPVSQRRCRNRRGRDAGCGSKAASTNKGIN